MPKNVCLFTWQLANVLGPRAAHAAERGGAGGRLAAVRGRTRVGATAAGTAFHVAFAAAKHVQNCHSSCLCK